MVVEVWILLLVVASILSAVAGYLYARRGAASRAEVESLERELDEARAQSDAIQSSVNEHFEQSAVLFGKLASDYREFLEHFSNSAQALGLSESRARELLEQGSQPLLTESVDAEQEVLEEEGLGEAMAAGPEAPAPEVQLAEAQPAEEAPAVEEEPAPPEEALAGVTDVLVEMPEPEADLEADAASRREAS